MASIDSMVFDKTVPYDKDDTVTLTVGYTPDAPGVVPETFTATTTLTDPTGAVLDTKTADFEVNQAVPAGDVVEATDTGNRTWTKASDDGAVALFQATA